MSKIIGIIAEDNSDVEVIIEILSKYVQRNSFCIKKFIGNGCGKLKNKCDSWAQLLFNMGCEHLLVFHDLDRNNETKLLKTLQKKIPPAKYPNSIIVIPIEELEAWLLSDSDAIHSVFSLPKKPAAIHHCEQVASPKEYLENLVWTIGKKRYVNTIHNQKLAKLVSLDNLRKCTSFYAFDNYIKSLVFTN